MDLCVDISEMILDHPATKAVILSLLALSSEEAPLVKHWKTNIGLAEIIP